MASRNNNNKHSTQLLPSFCSSQHFSSFSSSFSPSISFHTEMLKVSFLNTHSTCHLPLVPHRLSLSTNRVQTSKTGSQDLRVIHQLSSLVPHGGLHLKILIPVHWTHLQASAVWFMVFPLPEVQ
jgi:hypothetical protein